MSLQDFPAGIGHLGRIISVSVAGQADVLITRLLAFLQRAQHIKPSQLPLPTFTREYRRDSYHAMNGRSLFVDEFQRVGNTKQAPFDRRLVQTLPPKVPFQRDQPFRRDVDVRLRLDRVQHLDHAGVS